MSVPPMSCPGTREGNEIVLSRSTLVRKDRVAIDMVEYFPGAERGPACGCMKERRRWLERIWKGWVG